MLVAGNKESRPLPDMVQGNRSLRFAESRPPVQPTVRMSLAVDEDSRCTEFTQATLILSPVGGRNEVSVVRRVGLRSIDASRLS